MDLGCRLPYVAAMAAVLAAMAWGGAQGQMPELLEEPPKIRNPEKATELMKPCAESVLVISDWMRWRGSLKPDGDMREKLDLSASMLETTADHAFQRLIADLQRNNVVEAKKDLKAARLAEMAVLRLWKDVGEPHEHLRFAVVDNMFHNAIDCLEAVTPQVFE